MNVSFFKTLFVIDSAIGRVVADGTWVVPVENKVVALALRKMGARYPGQYYFAQSPQGPKPTRRNLPAGLRESTERVMTTAAIGARLALTDERLAWLRVVPDGGEFEDAVCVLTNGEWEVFVGEAMLNLVTEHQPDAWEYTGSGPAAPVFVASPDGRFGGVMMPVGGDRAEVPA